MKERTDSGHKHHLVLNKDKNKLMCECGIGEIKKCEIENCNSEVVSDTILCEYHRKVLLLIPLRF